jgi:hypothetical protein
MRLLPIGERRKAARQPRHARLCLEELESRITPYVTSGGAWPQPELITISFVADGTILGYDGQGNALTSTLFHDFAGLGSTSTWENQILKAAQVWAQQTNINFSLVSDDGATSGSGNYQQGDPHHGDIRIGGYQQGTANGQPLAYTYLPPQLNNYDIAGDVTFNTSEPFNIGQTYDLFTVAAHEIGHALGLSESNDLTAIEWPVYSGTFTGLASDDIAGIQAIYSNGNPRTSDGLSNNSFATAATVPINPTTFTAQLKSDITAPGDVDYYQFTAPSGSASTATISVQSAGLSMLAPKLYVYNANHTQIAFKNGAGQYGTTLTATVNITPGSTYFVKVIGADSSAFGTGVYALTINTGTGSSPTVVPPNTQTLNGSPLQSIGGQADLPLSAAPLAFMSGVALGTVQPAATVSGVDRAALALGLAQSDASRAQVLIISPNVTHADLTFQASPFQGAQVVGAPQVLSAWPEYGAGEAAAEADSDAQDPNDAGPDLL